MFRRLVLTLALLVRFAAPARAYDIFPEVSGVDPVVWTLPHLGERDPRCQRVARRTHLSFATG